MSKKGDEQWLTLKETDDWTVIERDGWDLEFHKKDKPGFLNRMRDRKILNGDNLEMIELAAGNGFLTKEFLKMRFIKEIDVEELGPANVEVLKHLKTENSKIGKVYETKIQDFQFEKKYDIIYSSQLLIYLTDLEMLQLFLKVKKNLKPDGVFIFMEYVNLEKRILRDRIWIRIKQLETYYIIAKLSGFKIMHQESLYFDDINYGHVYFTLKLDNKINNNI
jgi:SAM-dependent methyltransferase